MKADIANSSANNLDEVRVTLDEFRDKLLDIVRDIQENDNWIVVMQDGKPIAATISIEAFEFFKRAVEQAEDEIDIKESAIALAEAREQGTISLEELRSRLS